MENHVSTLIGIVSFVVSTCIPVYRKLRRWLRRCKRQGTSLAGLPADLPNQPEDFLCQPAFAGTLSFALLYDNYTVLSRNVQIVVRCRVRFAEEGERTLSRLSGGCIAPSGLKEKGVIKFGTAL